MQQTSKKSTQTIEICKEHVFGLDVVVPCLQKSMDCLKKQTQLSLSHVFFQLYLYAELIQTDFAFNFVKF